ncbi:Restriction modification system DNA specificity domain-containing protein [metagenome]
MRDRVYKNQNNESNDVLNEEQLIIKEIIELLVKEYGYDRKQIQTFSKPKDFGYDVAIFDSTNPDRIIMVGQIKRGQFVLPLQEYQLKEVMSINKIKYGFLYNGKERLVFELIDNDLIQHTDFPAKDHLQDTGLESKRSSRRKKLQDPEYKLRRISFLLQKRLGRLVGVNVFIQIMTCKIYDEIKLNGKYFEDVLHNRNRFHELWSITRDEFPQILDCDYSSLKNILGDIEKPIFEELSFFSIHDYDKMGIIKSLFSNLQTIGVSTNPTISDFIFKLLEFRKEDRILFTFSNPTWVYHLVENISQPNEPKIKIAETNLRMTEFWKLVSLLEIRELQHTTIDYRYSSLRMFDDTNFVISNPPFGIDVSDEFIEPNMEKFGKKEPNQFLANIVDIFQTGTRVVTIVPNSFLFSLNKTTQNTRNFILENCKINAIIQLPHATFMPWSSISCSLLIFEINKSKNMETDQVFMSIIPEYDFRNTNYITPFLNKVIENYRNFTKEKTLKEQTSLSFLVSSNELEDKWSVSGKEPELKQMILMSNRTFLGDVCESITNGKHIVEDTDILEAESICQIKISDIQNGFINTNNLKMIKIDSAKSGKYEKVILKPNDIILSCTGTIGKSAFITSERIIKWIPGSQFVIIRVNRQKILPEYLFQQLQSKTFQEQIKRIAKGISIPYTSIKDISNLYISVPPLYEQEKKVAEIRKLIGEIHDLEEKLRLKTQKLEEIGFE